MKQTLSLYFAVFVSSQLLTKADEGAAVASFRPNEVIAILGGQNMLQMQQSGLLEAQLVASNKKKNLRFRDLSWEGDTVEIQSSIHERWREEKYGTWANQLQHVGATQVWAQYGKMEAMAGLSNLQSFVAHYERLILEWKQVVDQITLISPIAFEPAPSSLQPELTQLNASLAVYVNVIETLATKHQLDFIDLFHPSLELNRTGSRLTENGLHVSPENQATFSDLIANALEINVQSVDDTLVRAASHKHRLWYEYWRPSNWKCLFGDDGERIFGEAAGIYPTFREEWSRYPALIKQAEQRIQDLAKGINPADATRVTPQLTGWSQVRPSEADASKALSQFQLLNGFQVNLFASEEQGLVNPLAFRWSSDGKLYVACSTAYPQHEPGEVPNDYIVVLEDTTGDGKADYSQVFAEGLNIPTGIEVAPNGIYVGQGTQLLLLQDHDGDDIADERKLVLSGFGNGDTHQTSNSFVWSPGGQLYWCQGDGIESRIETPWGISRLFQAGLFRLRPERMQLEGLLDDFMGPGNPWGVVFNDWGQPIVIDGAGGITHLGPALIPTHHRLRLPTIGKPGGYCGIDIASGPAIPSSMRGDYLIGDYKPNAVSRFVLEPNGASYKVFWKKPLITSRDKNFRPVDVKQGPDGAIYICDWFNTVICHQDDSYRHTARDKSHGRVWRVSHQTSTQPPSPSLARTKTTDLIALLGSTDRWRREHSKRQLLTRDRAQVLQSLKDWTRQISRRSDEAEFQTLQALMMYETLEQPNESVLRRCLKSKDPRARAYAARTVGRWYDRLKKPLDLLSPLTNDPSPQVRMETILACGNIPVVDAVQVAARTMRLPADRWIEYAFKQTVHHLEPHWINGLSEGTLKFGNNHEDLIHVIQASRSKEIATTIRQLATDGDADLRSQLVVRQVLAAIGTESDLLYLLSPEHYIYRSRYNSTAHRSILQSIIKARRERPALLNTESFSALLSERSTTLRIAAIQLAALWGIEEVHASIRGYIQNDQENIAIRVAAIGGLPRIQPNPDVQILTNIIESGEASRLQTAAVTALAEIAPKKAAALAVKKWVAETDFKLESIVVEAFLKRNGGSQALAREIGANKVTIAQAKSLLDELVSEGYSAPELTQALRDLAGYSSDIPEYSEAFITELAQEIQSQGDPDAGSRVYRSESANCTSCHSINGEGQSLGPDLSNAGTGIPIRRLIEEVIWPTRHVKEGYALTQITTKSGQIIQGYEKSERDQEDHFILMELGTENRLRVPTEQIESRQNIGTIMPPTAVSQLTRPQLRDLLSYLSKLGEF